MESYRINAACLSVCLHLLKIVVQRLGQSTRRQTQPIKSKDKKTTHLVQQQ